MPNQHDSVEEIKTKTIGGAIPEDLYWKFKQVQTSRKENATQALINAIRLYIDVAPAEEGGKTGE